MTTQLDKKLIFVFGSNLAGIHGKGAALTAKNQYGAIQGQGIGLQGHSYAIPTKDYNLTPLPLNEIRKYINEFIVFAINHVHYQFFITRIGCGLAGYKDLEIAPMFINTPTNCILPKEWLYILNQGK